MLALDERAIYASENFGYFKRNYPQFAYVDRIVVSPDYRRAGIGARLYANLFTEASDKTRFTCEVNVRPPNPGSLAFHERLGFATVAEQDTGGGEKRVALMTRENPLPI